MIFSSNPLTMLAFGPPEAPEAPTFEKPTDTVLDYSSMGIPDALAPWMPLIEGIALALIIFTVGWIISKWAANVTHKTLQKRKVDEALARFLASLAQYTVLGMTLIAALGKVGLPIASLVAVFGAAGLAIGLALQGNLGHFASGVMLLIFRPFTIGDFITAGGHTGTVEEVGLFATTMITPNNDKIIVANSGITGGSITNHTSLGKRRAEISVGVAYGEDMEKVKKVLADAANSCSMVLDDPGVGVAFVNFGASSLDFVVMPWSKPEDYIPMIGDVRTRIYDALNAANIEIPFDQVVMHQAPTE